MVIFDWPLMLGVAGVVALAGVWALWAGRRGVQRVSSTRLWAGLVESASGGRRRAVDPVWLMMLLAGVMAAVALAGPGWRIGAAAAPRAEVAWAVRSIRGGETEMFLRVRNAERFGGMTVAYGAGKVEALKVEEARRGVILKLAGIGEEMKVEVKLMGGGKVLAEGTFTRSAGEPFGLLTETGAGEEMDAALWRVFAVNSAARVDDVRAERRVLLVNDLGFEMSGVGAGTVVVALPGTRLPGIKLGERFVPVKAEPVGVDLPGFVDLRRVRVREARGAEVSGEWRVLARVDGRPWLVERKMDSGAVVVWMGSMPATESNWGLDTSFPVYFADLLARVFPEKGEVGSVLDWREERVAVGAGEGSGRVVGLSWVLGVGAMGLLVVGMVLLVRRGR